MTAPMIKTKLILITVIGITILIGLAYFVMSKAINTGPIACTMEAKICPDGSAVGRQGLRCEFAACPTITTLSWKTYADENVTFMYPENLGTTYITPQIWPPEVVVTKEVLTCNETGVQVTAGGQTKNVSINGINYCVTASGEGAAGSTYNAYTYRTQVGGNTVAVSFTLRFIQCANYDNPQKTICEEERVAFDIDTVVSRIAQTAKSI